MTDEYKSKTKRFIPKEILINWINVVEPFD
jgi:hypothetical protein